MARIAAIAIASLMIVVVLAGAQEAFSGQWLLDHATADSIHLTIRYSSDGGSRGTWNSMWSTDTAIASLRGLNMADLNSSGTNVHFQIVRDAGSFDSTGWASNGAASGHWNFVANPNFAAELKKRGLAEPSAREQFELAMSDVTLALVDELKADDYRFELADLIRAARHGISLEYVRGMKAAGYRFDNLETLTRMLDHGVTPRYVQELANYGYKNLAADELRRLRDHGVTGEFLRGMEQAGYKSLSSDDVVRLRDHGVTPEYIGAMAQAGYKGIPAQELSRLRDHGVSGEYVRGMAEAGYKDLGTDELARLSDHGVNPNYIRELAEAGFKNLGTSELVRMQDHGVSASYIREMKAAGVSANSGQLVRMRDHGVNGAFVREVKEHGFITTDPEELIRLRSQGIDARGRETF